MNSPLIIVTDANMQELTRRALDRSRTSTLCEIEVELPATKIREAASEKAVDPVTKQLNHVYARQPSEFDPAIRRAQCKTLSQDRW